MRKITTFTHRPKINAPFLSQLLCFSLFYFVILKEMMKRVNKSLRRIDGAQLRSKKFESNYGSMQTFGSKYGPPGRSANSGITATVFGAYGFIGRYFMYELGTYSFLTRFYIIRYFLKIKCFNLIAVILNKYIFLL